MLTSFKLIVLTNIFKGEKNENTLNCFSMFLSIFVLGINNSFAQEKTAKKTHHKTMMMDSTKVKTHNMEPTKDMMMDSTKAKTLKMKSTKATKSKSLMKSKKDTTKGY